jgi:Fe-S cluster assembly ATPase SufC
MQDGKIVKTGSAELAKELEDKAAGMATIVKINKEYA